MIPVAFVENRTSGVVRSLSLDWSKLSERLARCDIGEKDGSGWMPADIGIGARTAERVKSVTALVFDCEARGEMVNGEKTIVGPEPPAPDAMLAEVSLAGWRCILHTSHSHTPEHSRYRLIFDLARPLSPDELKPLGLHVAAVLGIGDCIDTGCLEPARLFYLPRTAAARRDIFHHMMLDGDALLVDGLLRDAARIAEAGKSVPRRVGQSGNVIEAFNGSHDVGVILEQHGYKAHGRRRWLWPGSTTGMPGVRLLPDAAPARVYSSHGGDPLNTGHAHDAFDLWRILQHGGDMTDAVKDAAHICGVKPQHDFQERKEKPPKSRISEIVDIGEFLSNIKPPQWLLEGIIQRSYLYGLTAHSNHGKTALAALMAVSVASGKSFAGQEVEAGNVLYLAGENPEDFKYRLMGICQAAGIPVQSIIEKVSILPATDRLISFIETVREHAKVKPLAMILVDTSAAYFSYREENENVDAKMHAQDLRMLIGATGAPAVIALCHPVKNAAQDNLIPRGGSGFFNEIDANLTLWKEGEVCELSHNKLRGPPFQPMQFKLTPCVITGLFDTKGRPVSTVAMRSMSEADAGVEQEKAYNAATQCLRAIHALPKPTYANIAAYCQWTYADGRPDKSKAQRTVKILIDGKFAVKELNKIELTEKGKNKLK